MINQPLADDFRKIDLWAVINGNPIHDFNAISLVSIVENETKDVYYSELRSYVNEIMAFALRETMRASEFKNYANR